MNKADSVVGNDLDELQTHIWMSMKISELFLFQKTWIGQFHV